MKVLASTKICVADWYPIIKKRGRDGIPFILFNLAPFLCFSKPEPGFPSLYYMVVFGCFFQWFEVKCFFHFVDIGWIF